MRRSAPTPFVKLTLLALLAGVLALVPAGQARAESLLTGWVASGGTPVAGAFVAVIGPVKATALTGADGSWAVTVPDGSYTVSTASAGYAVASQPVTVAGGTTAPTLALTPSGMKFDAVPVYGGQIGSVLADGTPGVFYASTSVIPQLYRTADYGGHWSPVTLAWDDAVNGIGVRSNIFRATRVSTSGSPGEVMAEINGTVYYSTDYGVTWQAINGAFVGVDETLQLSWAHGGDTSMIVALSTAGGALTLKVADLTAQTPAFTTVDGSALGSPSAWATGGGNDGAYLATAYTDGSVSVWTLDPSAPPLPVQTLTDLPTGISLVRFGGASGAAGSPNALMVYSSAQSQAVLVTKSSDSETFSAGDYSAATALPGPCNGQMAVSGVSPLSEGSTGAASLSQCFLSKTANGDAMRVSAVSGINNNTGFVFDSGYDGAEDAVILSGDGARGIVKSAHSGLDGVPVFAIDHDATAGTAPDSDGVAVTGFTVAVVKDTVFGPAGSTQFATITSGSGGNMTYATDDGGTTTATVVAKGGGAIAWWTGSGGHTWLVAGHGGGGNVLTAVQDWTSSTPPLAFPNVNTSGLQAAGLVGSLSSIVPVPGTDTVFLSAGDPASGEGRIFRATLSAGGGTPTLTGVTPIAQSSVTTAVNALAYCPSTADASVSDTLFAALGAGTTGALVRISGATGDSPSATTINTAGSGPQNEVRALCSNGVVWAGGGSNSGGPSGTLHLSTDGGSSFAAVPVSGPGMPPSINVTALAVDPSDTTGSTVLAAGNSEGFFVRTTDRGASWTVLNDPSSGGRSFMSEGVSDLELPGAPPAAAPAAAFFAPRATSGATTRPLVGTGGGLFRGRFSTSTPLPATTGVYDASYRGSWGKALVTTATGTSVSAPVLRVDGSLREHLVYRGSGGLYYTTRPSRGTWAAAGKVPGTGSADALPAAAVTTGGQLSVVWARTSGTPGVYLATRSAGGTWSAAVRLSAVSGDTSPSVALDSYGKAYLTWRRASGTPGIWFSTNRSGRWSTARVTGTGAADVSPSLAVRSTGASVVTWARTSGYVGVYVASRSATGTWTRPARRTTLLDYTPVVALDSVGKTHLVLRRTRGTAGLYYATDRTGAWTVAARLPGTSALDSAPAVATYGSTVRAAWLRGGTTAPGVYTALRGSGWSSATAIDRSSADRTPSLAVDRSGTPYVVWDRG